MRLSDYIEQSGTSRQAFADRIGVDLSYLSRLMSGKRRASWQLAGAIEEASGGAVTRHDLRPDIYPPPQDRAA